MRGGIKPNKGGVGGTELGWGLPEIIFQNFLSPFPHVKKKINIYFKICLRRYGGRFVLCNMSDVMTALEMR